MIWSVLVLLFSSALALEEALLAEGNPHQQDAFPACSCPAQALPPQTFLAEASLLKYQTDTFLQAEVRSHLGAPVNVLHFKQPGKQPRTDATLLAAVLAAL